MIIIPKTAVPFSQEEAPGVGIRRNGDDDDADGVDDLDPSDTAIAGENDLIEVDFMMPILPGIQYVLKRTNANINVFAQRNKGGAVLLDDSGEQRGTGSFSLTVSSESVR